MRVLVTIRKSPPQMYLVKLFTDGLIDEVRSLIGQRQHAKAILAVMTRGSLEKEVEHRDVAGVKADLILSTSNALWDLT